MSRFAVGVLLATLAVTALGFPAGLDGISMAAAIRDWKKVSELLDAYYRTIFRPSGFPAGLDGVSMAAANGDWKKVSELLDAYYRTKFWPSGFPAGLDGISMAAANGDMKKVSELLDAYYSTRYGLQTAAEYQGFPTGFGTTDVRSIQPQDGGHVYAVADYNFQSTTNDNGKLHQVSGGHRTVNQDGKITEMDYKPSYQPAIY